MYLPHHLKKNTKTGIFNFRLTVPQDLKYIYCKTELKFSLSTKDPVQAKLIAYQLSAKFLAEFQQYRALMSNNEDKRLGVANTWLDRVLGEDTSASTTPAKKPEVIFLPNGTPIEVRNGIHTFKIERDADGIPYIASTDPNNPQDFKDAKEALELYLKVREAARTNVVAPVIQPQPQAAVHSPASPVFTPTPLVSGTPLSVGIENYFKYREARKGFNKNTEADRISLILKFKAWHEANISRVYQIPNAQALRDFPIPAITHYAIATWAQDLMSPPDGSEGIGIKRVQTLGSYLHVMFEEYFQHKMGYYPREKVVPTDKQFTIKRAELENHQEENKGYYPFTEAELKNIFNPQTLLHQEEIEFTPHQVWFPLIGLYTGARAREVSDLTVNSFKLIKDINYVSIAGTKTAAALRDIPLHPTLIKLGLLDLVEDVKSLGYTQLFPYLVLGRNGYRKVPSDNFNAYLVSLGIKEAAEEAEDGKRGFHSFRDTVNHALIDVGEEKREDFIGHAMQGTNRKKYGKRFPVRVLNNTVIAELEYPFLDLTPFTYKKGQWLDLMKDLVKSRHGKVENRRKNLAAKEAKEKK